MASQPQQPTDFELEILQELWSRGPLTVRDVHSTLNARRKMVYTTVLKAMQVMNDKGLVTRDDSARSHVYAAAIDEQSTKLGIVTGIIDQVFGGSAAGLAMHALAARPASSDELRKVQDLLDQLEGEQHDSAPPAKPSAKSKRP
jgi:predicted transcriptional regulator